MSDVRKRRRFVQKLTVIVFIIFFLIYMNWIELESCAVKWSLSCRMRLWGISLGSNPLKATTNKLISPLSDNWSDLTDLKSSSHVTFLTTWAIHALTVTMDATSSKCVPLFTCVLVCLFVCLRFLTRLSVQPCLIIHQSQTVCYTDVSPFEQFVVQRVSDISMKRERRFQ